MLIVVVCLQVVLVVLVVALLLPKPAAGATPDDRLLRLPEAVSALHSRFEATDSTLRGGIDSLRREAHDTAAHGRREAEAGSVALRDEVTRSIATLGRTLSDGLNGFRADNSASGKELRLAVNADLKAIADRLQQFLHEANRAGLESRDALHGKLTELGQKNTESHDALRTALHQKLHDLGQDQHGHQERLRLSLQQNLDKLNTDNVAKLEQMRQTVDEKLQATLHSRLTESFGQVTTHLGDVQKGLGEMKELATGVSDLKKVFSNVKARGVVGEFQLGMQLEQMFSRDQYEKNVEVKAGSGERVEYALKVPQGTSYALFPIDSKFPREDWERLEGAYEHGGADEIARAGAAFERSIKAEGKRICEKYIAEPVTLPHAVMFLPTEGLYAEVMRRPGLQQELQQNCNVTIAGPSTFMAILTSFRMGFHTIAMERKGHEIEKVLGNVKSEFGKFGKLMNSVERQVGTVQNTLGKIAGKTKTINRSLNSVTPLAATDALQISEMEGMAGIGALLAVGEED